MRTQLKAAIVERTHRKSRVGPGVSLPVSTRFPQVRLNTNPVVVLTNFRHQKGRFLLRKLIFAGIFFCARFLSAQTQAPLGTPVGADQATLAFRQMELITRAARDANDEQARHTAEKQAEAYERLVFWQKANKFVALWEDFAARVNDHQTVDAKLAKKLSKAFHDLETSDGWPVRVLPANASEENK